MLRITHAFHSWFIVQWGSLFSVAVQLSIITAISFIYYEHPVTYARLTAEDNWGEFATFVSFAVASLLYAVRFTLSKTRKRDWWFLALAIGTFFLAMEEISWGQRLIGVPTPDLFLKYNKQGEIGFHNFSDSAMQSTYAVVCLGFVAYGVLLPIISPIYSPIGRLIKRLNLPLPTLYLTPLFLAPAYHWMLSGHVRNNEIVELFFGFALAAFSVEQVIYKSRLVNGGRFNGGLKSVAIPACLLGIFLSGVALTSFVDSSHFYYHNLNYMAFSKLPEAGHNKQAEAIVSYLEMNPYAAPKDLLLNKAQFLQTLGRHEEAIEVLKQARDFDLKNRMTSPDDFHVLSRLATIYMQLGNEVTSRNYLNEALAVLDREIADLDSEKPKAISSRPAWTYLIWGLEGVKDIKSRMIVTKGKLYSDLGKYTQAINEYLTALNYATHAETRDYIMNNISRALSKCRHETGVRKVTWQEIEQMSQQLTSNGIAPNWCGGSTN